MSTTIFESLKEEHDRILEFCGYVRNTCANCVENHNIPIAEFRSMVQFIRDYADGHHHGKEEKILFKEMLDRMGGVAVNLVQHGMLVEHDWARLLVTDLEKALDEYEKTSSNMSMLNIIANAVGYCNLLERHIEKENTVVYPYAEKNLDPDVVQKMTELAEKMNREDFFMERYSYTAKE
ncbi:hemerythrin domain-containing protein [Faecalispora anaeroviscerum]|uniref:hemerythrin domain-containing protein n=1 Tax=Faecalispora anaeroviscerum TaxID=2991836 RepID=UPI0024B95118|nr:hemerythrin domain-containing protein [Faecalispora anaeroviscerum]